MSTVMTSQQESDETFHLSDLNVKMSGHESNSNNLEPKTSILDPMLTHTAQGEQNKENVHADQCIVDVSSSSHRSQRSHQSDKASRLSAIRERLAKVCFIMDAFWGLWTTITFFECSSSANKSRYNSGIGLQFLFHVRNEKWLCFYSRCGTRKLLTKRLQIFFRESQSLCFQIACTTVAGRICFRLMHMYGFVKRSVCWMLSLGGVGTVQFGRCKGFFSRHPLFWVFKFVYNSLFSDIVVICVLRMHRALHTRITYYTYIRLYEHTSYASAVKCRQYAMWSN